MRSGAPGARASPGGRVRHGRRSARPSVGAYGFPDGCEALHCRPRTCGNVVGDAPDPVRPERGVRPRAPAGQDHDPGTHGAHDAGRVRRRGVHRPEQERQSSRRRGRRRSRPGRAGAGHRATHGRARTTCGSHSRRAACMRPSTRSRSLTAASSSSGWRARSAPTRGRGGSRRPCGGRGKEALRRDAASAGCAGRVGDAAP